MKTLRPRVELPVPAGQLSIPLDSLKLRGLARSERSIVIARLAILLMTAAGVPTEESDDDGQ